MDSKMIQVVKNFGESIKSDTNIRILWKNNKRYNYFFEMGNYGLIRNAYNNEGELRMYMRMLATPFIVKDVLVENDKTYFVIEVIDSFENRIIRVKNYFQFKKQVDDMNMVVTTEYLKTAFHLIINEFVMAREKFKEQKYEITGIRYINEEFIFLVEEKKKK